MNDYAELIKRLRTATTLPVMNALCQEAADAIEELSKPGWISVKDRLPKLGEIALTVDVQDEPDYCVMRLQLADPGVFVWEDEAESWYPVDEFSHWMPLPEPPKEKI